MGTCSPARQHVGAGAAPSLVGTCAAAGVEPGLFCAVALGGQPPEKPKPLPSPFWASMPARAPLKVKGSDAGPKQVEPVLPRECSAHFSAHLPLLAALAFHQSPLLFQKSPFLIPPSPSQSKLLPQPLPLPFHQPHFPLPLPFHSPLHLWSALKVCFMMASRPAWCTATACSTISGDEEEAHAFSNSARTSPKCSGSVPSTNASSFGRSGAASGTKSRCPNTSQHHLTTRFRRSTPAALRADRVASNCAAFATKGST